MKKLICFILVLTMLAGMTVFASAEGTPSFVVSSGEAAPGEEVQITVRLENNPGLASAELNVEYDPDVLEWTKVEQGDYTGGWDAKVGVAVTWGGGKNTYTDGLFCTLTFKVKENAEEGDTVVTVSYEDDDVFNEDLDNVYFAIVPGKVTVTAPKGAPVDLYGASVSLKGDIALNFFLIPTEELLADADAYVTLTAEGGTPNTYLFKDASTRTVSGKKLYQFSIALNAKQMTDKVTVAVYSGDGTAHPIHRMSEDVTEDTFAFAIQDYIQKTIAVYGNDTGKAKLVKMVKAMSDYGSLAQARFAYKTEERAEVQADLDAVTAETLASYAIVKPSETAAGVASCSLVLNSETAIRLYIKMAEGEEISSRSIKVNGVAQTPVNTEKGWMVEIPNISAKDLDKLYEMKIADGEGATYTVKFSALSYAYGVLTTEGQSAEQVALVKGLYLYNQAANEYFG